VSNLSRPVMGNIYQNLFFFYLRVAEGRKEEREGDKGTDVDNRK
jgi:hypothetical protein